MDWRKAEMQWLLEVYGDYIGGGTCQLDSYIFDYCPTRVNIYVARIIGGAHPIIIKHWSPAISARSAGTIVLKLSR